MLWASTHPPRVPHGRVCEVNGDCPTGATAEHLVVPACAPLPAGVLTARATAGNRAGLNSTEQAADFELDATPPVAAVPQALLFQPQAAFVSLAALWDVYADAECAEGADRGIQLLSWSLYTGPSLDPLPECALPSPAPPDAAGHAVAGGCNSADAELVCVRLQWRACNGLWALLSAVVCQNWTAQVPSCSHAPRFTAAPPAAGDAYRMWRVHPDLQDVGCLRYEGNTSYGMLRARSSEGSPQRELGARTPTTRSRERASSISCVCTTLGLPAFCKRLNTMPAPADPS